MIENLNISYFLDFFKSYILVEVNFDHCLCLWNFKYNYDLIGPLTSNGPWETYTLLQAVTIPVHVATLWTGNLHWVIGNVHQ